MRALVKEKAEPGIWMRDIPNPNRGTTTSSSASQDRDLRHRHPYL